MILWLFLLFPILFAVSPLFGTRFIPTHDGEYHIIRFWQYFTSLSQGTLIPRWAPNLNHGYGLPLFTFQYSFPNLIGSILHMVGIPYVTGVQWTLGLGYLTALVFCYLFLQSIFPKRAAMLGTLIGAFVPYWFVDLYVRGSVGEVWAIAWVFASLFFIAKNIPLGLTVSVWLLIISHNILAMLFVPVIFLYSYVKRKNIIPSVFFGIGAATYFWLPALYEQRFITGLSNVSVTDYFPELWQLLIPSWGTGFRGETTGATEMSYQIGITPIFIVVLSIYYVIRNRKNRIDEVLLALSGFLLMLFLIQPISTGIWTLITSLQFVQYPWRLLSSLLVIIPILGAYLASEKKSLGWILSILAIVCSFGYSRPVTYEPRTDAQYIDNPNFSEGTSSLGNAFTTIWMKGKNPPKERVFTIGNGNITIEEAQSTLDVLSVDASDNTSVTVPVSYYPSWRVSRDQNIPIQTEPNTDGLLSFLVPKGHHRISVTLRQTPIENFSLSISVVCFFFAILLWVRQNRMRTRRNEVSDVTRA